VYLHVTTVAVAAREVMSLVEVRWRGEGKQRIKIIKPFRGLVPLSASV
jgi:hypothetical protein